jgi:hypothetical protein
MTDKQKKNITLFFVAIAAVSVAAGFSDGLFSNYFKDAYNVNGFQRGLIELPRELPGVITFFLISVISFFGDITIGIIAQGLCVFGLMWLGLLTPPFAVMLIFLFISSMGTHLYMPLQDSIGMRLAEPERLGNRMGQYAGIRFAFALISGIAVFLLFHYGVFSFTVPVKWTFVVLAALYAVALLLFIKLRRDAGKFVSRAVKSSFFSAGNTGIIT